MHENPHITKVAVLQRKPNNEYALQILQDITKQVSYLMKEEKFKVQTLVEFYPKDKRLLGMNVNAGQKIMLRLRTPGDEFQFLNREAILGTMLHELTHNLFGPHDRRFYEKLDQLSARQWVIEQQGLFDTFLGSGRRLGGSTRTLSNNRRVRSIIGRSGKGRGRKLGTITNRPSSTFEGKTPREMAAVAAERRYNDDKWCGEKNNLENKKKLEPNQDDLREETIIILDDDDATTTPETQKENKDDDDDIRPIEIIDLT
ncbi:hypothetical protein NCAS_0B07190 [Naumovozyma castellii]|uniref:WLM domain-containing protein n=1 Tax=Naumovozyma castellii TaxID=27288 RepID=G0VA73_NAUCA|nr:hypothetical protein NCAS_0B07190 [Naumovozyma castellii CBS 4309]CCC68803.1 hypothetical protein NCAS_0B07190 [Naumovozyma castellii CBS 4309]